MSTPKFKCTNANALDCSAALDQFAAECDWDIWTMPNHQIDIVSRKKKQCRLKTIPPPPSCSTGKKKMPTF